MFKIKLIKANKNEATNATSFLITSTGVCTPNINAASALGTASAKN